MCGYDVKHEKEIHFCVKRNGEGEIYSAPDTHTCNCGNFHVIKKKKKEQKCVYKCDIIVSSANAWNSCVKNGKIEMEK